MVDVASGAFQKELAKVMTTLFQRAFADWKEMIGFEAQAKSAAAKVVKSSKALLPTIVGQGVLVRTVVEGATGGPVFFAFPGDLAGAAIAKALMLPGAGHVVDPSSVQHVEAAKELMNLFCGSTTQALEERGGPKARVSQSLDHLVVEVAPTKPEGFEDGAELVRLDVDVESGAIKAKATCLIPVDVAAALL